MQLEAWKLRQTSKYREYRTEGLPINVNFAFQMLNSAKWRCLKGLRRSHRNCADIGDETVTTVLKAGRQKAHTFRKCPFVTQLWRCFEIYLTNIIQHSYNTCQFYFVDFAFDFLFRLIPYFFMILYWGFTRFMILYMT